MFGSSRASAHRPRRSWDIAHGGMATRSNRSRKAAVARCHPRMSLLTIQEELKVAVCLHTWDIGCHEASACVREAPRPRLQGIPCRVAGWLWQRTVDLLAPANRPATHHRDSIRRPTTGDWIPLQAGQVRGRPPPATAARRCFESRPDPVRDRLTGVDRNTSCKAIPEREGVGRRTRAAWPRARLGP